MTESPFETTFLVGTITAAEDFEKPRKPKMMTLEIDLGDRSVNSAAQLGYNHEPDELIGRQVIVADGLGTVNIAGFESEVLTVGVPDEDGHPVLVSPDEAVPDGGVLH